MKKTMVLLAALLTASFAWAQQLPDGGFEEWKTGKTVQDEIYDDLANSFWQTLNVLSTLPKEMGTGPIVVFKDKGKYGACPRMESNQLSLGEKTIFLPGLVGSLTVIVDKQTADLGRPFSAEPESLTSLKGFMKYKSVNNDSAMIWAQVFSEGEMIGNGEQKYYESVTDWQEFDLPIRYRKDSPIDSICVLFVSSAGVRFDSLFECKGEIGSTLWVDGCRFVIDGNDPGAPDTNVPPLTANEAADMLNVRTYPNPATDVLNVVVEENAQLTIFDQAGRVLLQQAVVAGENALNIANLKAGFYTYRVMGAQKNGSGKFIKK
ncbi:MAG: T9SS type A sorting domain-containing protein [Bacteroidales bacterium]|nr:T9SS type A sorting domain-containing protein [Bacteroidales bacterium]